MQWFFLVGFMGVGKTTLGAAVAKKLGLHFYDLDEQIELDTGARIPEIFATEGEERFRDYETRVLEKLIATGSGGIVATGGGTFTLERNRALMARAGAAVWLDAPIDVIVERVGGDERPLWRNEAEARALAERRKKYYRLAKHHLELGTDSTEDGTARLYGLLESHIGDS